MGRLQAEIILPLGDAEYLFALKFRQLENLEKEVGDKVSDIAYRVVSLRPGINDIKQILLLGLEGGGTPPEQAAALFKRYVEGRPLFDQNDPSSPAILAAKVIEAAWFGVEDIKDDPAKKAAEVETAAGSTSGDTEPHS